MWYATIQLHALGYKAGVTLCPQTAQIDCGEVLLSRYAQWLGMPIAGLGVFNYAALLAVALGLQRWIGGGTGRLL